MDLHSCSMNLEPFVNELRPQHLGPKALAHGPRWRNNSCLVVTDESRLRHDGGKACISSVA
jgi:hypothetical protein